MPYSNPIKIYWMQYFGLPVNYMLAIFSEKTSHLHSWKYVVFKFWTTPSLRTLCIISPYDSSVLQNLKTYIENLTYLNKYLISKENKPRRRTSDLPKKKILYAKCKGNFTFCIRTIGPTTCRINVHLLYHTCLYSRHTNTVCNIKAVYIIDRNFKLPQYFHCNYMTEVAGRTWAFTGLTGRTRDFTELAGRTRGYRYSRRVAAHLTEIRDSFSACFAYHRAGNTLLSGGGREILVE